MLTPSGGQHCGVERHDHCQRWTTDARWHKWAAPTQEQIKARMLARREQRLVARELAVLGIPVIDTKQFLATVRAIEAGLYPPSA